MPAAVNGEVSHWWHQLTGGAGPQARPALPGDTEADVAIVGAGYTGLWTAYHLARLAPTLRILVLEERFAGYGASGRNGGWLTNTVTGGPGQYVARHGREAAAAQQRALTASVHQVVQIARSEGIDADVRLGGELNVARSRAQLDRMHDDVRAAAAWPGTDWEVLDARATADRVRVEGALGAMWHPHAARVDPAKLVVGLAAAVERAGVTIHE
ncbi:MAG: NAD(P)/FAD-dependent oxidoreductase, partial [Nocardioides sp.]|uniref:NAD(P)/FAD-dependent oxidoreductase n=1 Tax=Nocardioides sp. TaxID=35761 RepID=UPI003F00B80E